MFFVWTSNGGPLQYVGLGLFLLQALPRVLPGMAPMSLLTLIVPVAIVMGTFRAWQAGTLPQFQREMARLRNKIRRRLRRWTGMPWTDWGVALLIGGTSGILLGGILFLDVYWWSVISQLIAISVVLCTHFNIPQAAQQAADRASRQAKMQVLTDLVNSIPIEHFVPEDYHHHCSIAELKQMLRIRGVTDEELHSYIDRQNLEEALSSRRKFSDTCCICFDTYEEQQPIRVLPKCGHELHIECLDKWVYTFASSSKRRQDPSCPLCKKVLK